MTTRRRTQVKRTQEVQRPTATVVKPAIGERLGPAKGQGGAARAPFIVLTGLSGSGKSQAIRALEDLGYFCVDNLPTTLIPTLATLSIRGGEIDKVAIVVDVRERNFLSSFPGIFKRLKRMRGLNPVLIFLEASNSTLVRRFSETRRPHPLARDRSASEGIRAERSRMRAIRDMADEIVDTSEMTVHQLRQFFTGLSRDRRTAGLVATVLSFGYKHGVPLDADLVFDVRCLPNPHFVPALREKTGRDRAVVAFVRRDASSAREFIEHLEDYVRCGMPCRTTWLRVRAILHDCPSAAREDGTGR